MQKHLRDLVPDKLDDLIAMNALYRPGPLQYIPDFIERNHGRQAITFDLPEMEEYLKDTYGITVYQEQVMLLSQKLANFSKGDADTLRKAMGKKQKAVLDKMKNQFMEGTAKNGHPAAKAEKIWSDWEAFAEYAFNKSHSTCYAFVAYQTAYLKAHYPSEFMASLLNHAGSIDKIAFFMQEAKRMKIEVLGPDVNESQKGFTVNKKGQIRFGLAGVKGVGDSAIDELVLQRKKNGPFKDIFDMIKRVNQRAVNKKSLEGLAYSGALDCFTDMHRAQYFHVPKNELMNGIERIVKFGNQVEQAQQQAIGSLFGDTLMNEIPNPKIPEAPRFHKVDELEFEKEVIGMYLSGHPLDAYQFEFNYCDITSIAVFNHYSENIKNNEIRNKVFLIAGLVTSATERLTKTGVKFGLYTIEDMSGSREISLFRNDYINYGKFFEKGNCVAINITHTLNYEKTNYFVQVQNVSLLENLKLAHVKTIQLTLHASKVDNKFLQFMTQYHQKNKGNARLKIRILHTEKEQALLKSSGDGIRIESDLIEFLEANDHIDIKVNPN
jgi:DNA polymerase-3 subunit alpha